MAVTLFTLLDIHILIHQYFAAQLAGHLLTSISYFLGSHRSTIDYDATALTASVINALTASRHNI